MIVRGTGTDAYYVLEADPTTGEIPVSLAGASIAIDFSGPTGDAVPADAGFVGGVDGSGDLRGLLVDTAGNLQIDVVSSALPTGASTEAKQDDEITQLTIVSGDTTSIDSKIPALGQAVMAASVPVAIASDQSSIPVDITGDSTQGKGAADATTMRVTEGSRTYADSDYHDYSSGNVTTAAWVELIASTAANINLLCITDQSGQVMELGVGAALSESRIFLISPGFSGCIPISVASGSRVAVKAVSATASSGGLTISGLN
jgi:hypothetical protein